MDNVTHPESDNARQVPQKSTRQAKGHSQANESAMFEKLGKLFRKEDQESAPSSPPRLWPEEPLESSPWSVHGIRLGASASEVAAALRTLEAGEREPLRKPSALCWRWGPHGMSSVIFRDGRVEEVWGSQLEQDGAALLHQGDSEADLRARLGPPTREFGYSLATEKHLFFETAPLLLDVTVTTEDAHGSPAHQELFGSSDVVGRLFQVCLKLQP